MDMNQAAVFLAGSILTALGVIIIIAAAVAINNLLHKYWKPVRIFTSDSFQPFGQPMRYATAEELEKLTPSKDTK